MLFCFCINLIGTFSVTLLYHDLHIPLLIKRHFYPQGALLKLRFSLRFAPCPFRGDEGNGNC